MPINQAFREPFDSATTSSATDPTAVVAVDGYEDLEPLLEELVALPAGRRRCLGVVKAVDRFDPARGPRFLGFAIPTITGEIRRYFRDHTWTMRIPRSLKDLHTKVTPAVHKLSQRLGRAPTAGEIAAEIDADAGDVSLAITAGNAYQPMSLDAPAYGRGNTPISESLCEDEERYDRIEQCAAVAPLIAALDQRQRRILRLRFFESMTLTQTQIAASLGISQMHVSRILSQTLTTLRADAAAAT